MIVHKVSIRVFWGFVMHRLDAMDGEVEAAPIGDEYGPWLERTALSADAPPVGTLHTAGPLWRPIAEPDPLDPLDVRNYVGYAVAAGELLGVDAPRPAHGRYADPTWSAYWEACERRTAEAGARFVWFGDDDVEYVAVAHAASVREAHGRAALVMSGDRERVGADIEVDGWRAQLQAFCDATGIAWREPRWFASVGCNA